jgi:hypothetical protein
MAEPTAQVAAGPFDVDRRGGTDDSKRTEEPTAGSRSSKPSPSVSNGELRDAYRRLEQQSLERERFLRQQIIDLQEERERLIQQLNIELQARLAQQRRTCCTIV